MVGTLDGVPVERDDLCAIRQKPASDRQFQGTEAQDLPIGTAHGTSSLDPVLEETSPGCRVRAASWLDSDQKPV
jgi:hypothetical protein